MVLLLAILSPNLCLGRKKNPRIHREYTVLIIYHIVKLDHNLKLSYTFLKRLGPTGKEGEREVKSD